jgi:capsular polysaccharide biosynthesis protein
MTTDRTPHSTASSSIYVGASRFSFDAGTADPNATGGQLAAGLERLIATFAAMIHSEPIAQDAVELTGVQRSASSVLAETVASPLLGTNLLVVTVTDTDPAMAQQLSIGMAETFVRKIKDLEPGKPVGEGQVPSAPATIFERAKLPTVPTQQGLASKLLTAGLFGFAAAAGAAFFVEYLDITVKTAEDAQRRLELPILGVVPLFADSPPAVLRPTRVRQRDDIGLVRDG